MKYLILILFPFSLLAQSTPNIIFIWSDDMGYGETSYTGSVYDTPEIDSLIANGFFSSNFHVRPICTASRFAFMTGNYSFRANLDYNVIYPYDSIQHGLGAEWFTLPEHLKEAGYMCGHFGKWHLGTTSPEYFPLKHGFDYSWGSTQGHSSLKQFVNRGVWNKIENMVEDRSECEWGSTCLTDKLLAWASDQKDDTSSPFFAYVNYVNPHDNFVGGDTIPYLQSDYDLAPGGYTEDQKQKWASIKNLDDEIGRIIDSLESWGIDSNTVVVFTTDNGPDPTNAPETGIYQGNKWENYEGGLRVPFVWYQPGTVTGGATSDSLLAIEDMLPTFVEGVAGHGLRDSTDGINFYPLLSGGAIPDRHWVGAFLKDRMWCVIKGQWKLANNIDTQNTSFATLPNNIELFDLANDPGESTDVSGSNPAKVTELQTIIDSYSPPVTRPGAINSAPAGWEDPRWWGDPWFYYSTDYLYQFAK
jgi:arylsulfatase A-like enzyme